MPVKVRLMQFLFCPVDDLYYPPFDVFVQAIVVKPLPS